MKYCKFCGSKIDDDSVFCSACGRSLADAPTQAKKPTESTPSPDVVITPGSCPNCGSASYQITKTHESQIKRPRVCNNCGNSYRTVKDIQSDIEYCKSALGPIAASGIILFIVILIIASAVNIFETCANWDWASDDKKGLVIFVIAISIAGAIAVLPSLTKRAKEIDELTEEKDHLEAKNRALDIKNASTIPDYKTIYKNTNSHIGKNNSIASVKYVSAVPTENDFERLIEISGLREFIMENYDNDVTYREFYLNILNGFKEMTKDSQSNNSRFICKKGNIEIDIKIAYGEGTLSCEMNFKC